MIKVLSWWMIKCMVWNQGKVPNWLTFAKTWVQSNIPQTKIDGRGSLLWSQYYQNYLVLLIALRWWGYKDTTKYVHWWKLDHYIGVQGGTTKVLVEACETTLCVNFPRARLVFNILKSIIHKWMNEFLCLCMYYLSSNFNT